jgi:hypothetical protein
VVGSVLVVGDTWFAWLWVVIVQWLVLVEVVWQ